MEIFCNQALSFHFLWPSVGDWGLQGHGPQSSVSRQSSEEKGSCQVSKSPWGQEQRSCRAWNLKGWGSCLALIPSLKGVGQKPRKWPTAVIRATFSPRPLVSLVICPSHSTKFPNNPGNESLLPVPYYTYCRRGCWHTEKEEICPKPHSPWGSPERNTGRLTLEPCTFYPIQGPPVIAIALM